VSWIDVVDDPRGIRAIYGARVPALVRAVLHEIRLHRDGPRVTFVVDLPEYPRSPPRRWAAQRFNTVQIHLTVDGVHSVTINGLSTTSVVDLELMKVGDEVRAVTSAKSSSVVDVRGRWAWVNKISAYLVDTAG